MTTGHGTAAGRGVHPLLAGLNAAQRSAVEAVEGPVLILAGPGSGKTRVITHRIAYLLQELGVAPSRILAVTFTNKAAREMRERLHQLAGQAAEHVQMGTFHAMCVRLLRREHEAFGIDRAFSIYDDADQLAVVKAVLAELRLDPKKFAPRALLSAISRAKSEMIVPSAYPRDSYFDEIVQRVYEGYQARLLASNAFDFDDLILAVVRRLEQRPELLDRLQRRFVHVLVDEFQDTNQVQYRLVQLLAGHYRNICVVGDPDQSIYSWRAADIRNILDFQRDYPDARLVRLEQNYRSTQTILDAAHGVIAANAQRLDKNLWTEKGPGSRITVMEAYNEEEEARYVVQEIERLLREEGVSRREVAVLYRTNALSRALEEAFVRHGMPYKLVAGTRFYERKEVKDALAYLRVLANPYDEVSLLRVINVPGRGIGERTLDDLVRWARDEGLPLFTALQVLAAIDARERSIPDAAGDEGADGAVLPESPFNARSRQALLAFHDLMQDLQGLAGDLVVPDLLVQLYERTGYRAFLADGTQDGAERWENLEELANVAEQYRDLGPEESLRAFLEETALISDVDGLDDKPDAVTLITLHAAKGLEFPVVFMVGMEDGVFPHIRSFDDPVQMEEERRLAYVGITRAMDRLYLVRAFRRTVMGTSMPNPPSRFLRDIPADLVEAKGNYQQPRVQQPLRRGLWQAMQGRSAAPRQGGPGFRTGDHVRHEHFGEGIVVTVTDARDGDQEVTVAFRVQGIKKLLASVARLERLSGG